MFYTELFAGFETVLLINDTMKTIFYSRVLRMNGGVSQPED